MREINEACLHNFKLIFSKNESDNIIVKKTGKICICGNDIRLDYENTVDTIGWNKNSGWIIRTLHQNVLPLYARIIGDEVWLSNDIAELLIEGEIVFIRRVELLLAAAGSQGIRTALSHLIEDILLLMPLSRYLITFENDSPSITWCDIDFEFSKTATKEKFLEFLIDQYKKVYSKDPEICLAISGGWDSRLELAILTHLGKKVHCYHATISKREAVQARRVAKTAGASFQQFPVEELVLLGWDFIKQKGYLTRWDGFFAPGVLYSAGLYSEMKNAHPGSAIRVMSSLTGWKGRLYEQSGVLLEYWLQKEESYFETCQIIFPKHSSILKKELERRKKAVTRLISAIIEKCPRTDIAVDISYNMLAYSRMDTRETFLIENGMPVFDGEKEAGDFFISLPENDKKQPNLLEWAIGKMNPELKKLPQTTSSMNRTEREFGLLGRIRFLNRILPWFSKIDQAYNQDWLKDPDVIEIFNQIPEIYEISKRLNGNKSSLFIAQICRFLKTLQNKKKVVIRIVE